MLDSFSTDKLSIKIYGNQFFRSDFIPICEYVFRLSFLTTLNIYKDYFNVRQRLHNCSSVKQSLVHANCDRRQNLPSSSFSRRSCYVCIPQGFVTKGLHDLHLLDELKNFAANILLKFVIMCILRSAHLFGQSRTRNRALKRRDCYYRTSPIGYWGKGSTVGW